MEPHTICIAQPMLFVVWTTCLANGNGDQTICRAHAIDESALRSGERRFIASSEGGQELAMSAIFPDRAVLRAPGEYDRRKEMFDRVMRTQFALLTGMEKLGLKLPFAIAATPRRVSTYRGRVLLNYMEFGGDPGFTYAVEEAEQSEAFAGRSDIAFLTTEARVFRFEVGDSIPVFVITGSGKTFAILELIEKVGDSEFACRLTTENPLNDTNDSFDLTRELRVRALSMNTGDLILKSYSGAFASIILGRDTVRSDEDEASGSF